jgi:molybdenum cofactor synthesis domain-containing protein
LRNGFYFITSTGFVRKTAADSTPMIPINEAFAAIDRETPRLGTEKVPLGELVGRILAENVVADSDLPPFDRSQMDGFAIRAGDTGNAPIGLKIVGESAAGHGWDGVIASGQAVRIMTGARVPDGADAVQKLELTEDASADDSNLGAVRILESTDVGRHIVKKGAEVAAGAVVFEQGGLITTSMIASIAAFGYAELMAGTRPRVSVLSTGSEIVPVDQTPARDQIRNSNTPMIAALVREYGGIPAERPLAVDDTASLTDAISGACRDSDILVITGGVSVGKYDLTKDVLRSLGAEIFFERVKLKPGKPAVFARLGETLVFGLPGNPVSAAVTFHLFVRRAMRIMQGAAEIGLRTGHAAAAKNMKAAAERDTFLPAAVTTDETGRALATPLKWLGSSDFIGFARADPLAFIPAGEKREAGDVVRTYSI